MQTYKKLERIVRKRLDKATDIFEINEFIIRTKARNKQATSATIVDIVETVCSEKGWVIIWPHIFKTSRRTN